MHIALLDVDVPVPTVYRARGLYSSQFRHLLECAAARLNRSAPRGRRLSIFTSTYDVVGGALPPLASLRTAPDTSNSVISSSSSSSPANPLAAPIDAILITGAAAAAYALDAHPWIRPLQSFLQTVYTDYPHVKLFGSCFGHQILAQALLSPAFAAHDPARALRVEPAGPAGSEMGLVAVALRPEFVARFAMLRALPAPACLRLQMVHGDWVVPVKAQEEDMEQQQQQQLELPAGWVHVGASARCPVQGLYCPDRVLTFQGHFEFDVFVTRETVREFGRRYGWAEEVVSQYVREVEKGREGCEAGEEDNDDSRVAAEVVVMFFAEG